MPKKKEAMKRKRRRTRRRRRPGVTNKRTLDWLAKKGYTADTVERWIGAGKFKRRKDLFGIFDFVALRADKTGILGVQATGGSGDLARRLKKALGKGEDQTPEERRYVKQCVRLWLECGNGILLIGWRELKTGWKPWTIRIVLRNGKIVVKDRKG